MNAKVNNEENSPLSENLLSNEPKLEKRRYLILLMYFLFQY